MTYTAEQLIDKYVEVRDAKAALAEKHKGEMEPYNKSLEVIEAALQDMLNQTGGDSIKTKAGTAYRSTATTAKMESWPEFIGYVQHTGDYELLVRNVNKTRLEECLNAGRSVPGCSMGQIQRINVRRG